MLHRNVAPGIHRIDHSYTNFYLVETDGTLTVVDACVPPAWQALQDAVRDLGRKLDDVQAVVLTHGHFDHIGFAERARKELGVPVYVHTNDVPLTRNPRQASHERPFAYYLATQPQAAPIVASFLANRAWWPSPIRRVERFEAALDLPDGPRIVPTPGHTLGHVSLHFPERDALIAGDAVVTFNPYRGRPGPQLVAQAATADSERALESLDRIAETGAQVVLTGHGEPWRDGAEAIAERARAAGVN